MCVDKCILQCPHLQNDLYCVEWDVKLYYTIPYITVPAAVSLGEWPVMYLHCALAEVQCIVIGPVCVGVGVWICYHDISKFRSSILTKLGL